MQRQTSTGLRSYTADSGLNSYLDEIGRIPLLTATQEVALAAKVKTGDETARDLMIRSNLRLVVTIAQDYANVGLPLWDLISEGNLGLTKAIERFDPSRGAKLSTYAAWWIKQAIKRALADQSKTIRLPTHMVDKLSKIRRVSLQMSHELGREPTDEELAEEIGIASAKLSQLKTVSIRPSSLDAAVSEEDATQLGDLVADEAAETSYEWLRDQELQRHVKTALQKLNDRENKILSQRFGLDGGEPKTFEEVGQNIGLTRERIRQLQAAAITKLRRALMTDKGLKSLNLSLTQAMA
jgi:RNA polymerase primary sigma factor